MILFHFLKSPPFITLLLGWEWKLHFHLHEDNYNYDYYFASDKQTGEERIILVGVAMVTAIFRYIFGRFVANSFLYNSASK